jgi:hypothetical protein
MIIFSLSSNSLLTDRQPWQGSLVSCKKSRLHLHPICLKLIRAILLVDNKWACEVKAFGSFP